MNEAAFSIRQLLLMYVGTLCGTTGLLSAYVWFAEATPEAAFRHMAPVRFYFFIPFFAFWALGVGVAAETLWFGRLGTPLRSSAGCLFLGAAYSGVWLGYGVAGVWRSALLFPLSYLAAFALAWLIHVISHARGR